MHKSVLGGFFNTTQPHQGENSQPITSIKTKSSSVCVTYQSKNQSNPHGSVGSLDWLIKKTNYNLIFEIHNTKTKTINSNLTTIFLQFPLFLRNQTAGSAKQKQTKQMSHESFARVDEFEMALKIKPMQKKQNEINKQKTNLIIYTPHNPNSSQSLFGCREI